MAFKMQNVSACNEVSNTEVFSMGEKRSDPRKSINFEKIILDMLSGALLFHTFMRIMAPASSMII